MNNHFDLQNLIQGFKLSCQTENKSPKTVEWYTSFVTRFRRFLELNNLPSRIDKIDRSLKNGMKIYI